MRALHVVTFAAFLGALLPTHLFGQGVTLRSAITAYLGQIEAMREARAHIHVTGWPV